MVLIYRPPSLTNNAVNPLTHTHQSQVLLINKLVYKYTGVPLWIRILPVCTPIIRVFGQQTLRVQLLVVIAGQLLNGLCSRADWSGTAWHTQEDVDEGVMCGSCPPQSSLIHALPALPACLRPCCRANMTRNIRCQKNQGPHLTESTRGRYVWECSALCVAVWAATLL